MAPPDESEDTTCPPRVLAEIDQFVFDLCGRITSDFAMGGSLCFASI